MPSWAVYEALRAAFGSKVPPPRPETQEGTTLPNPYRGLLVFGVKDAPLFFGRAKIRAKLKHPTKEWPLGEIDSIVEKLRSGSGALGDLVSDVLTEPEQRLLLVIDQLEELYSMVRAKSDYSTLVLSVKTVQRTGI